jgi:PAS domain S-box-containing protein
MIPRAFALVTGVSAVVYALALVVVVTSDTDVSVGATIVALIAGASWIAAGLIAVARRPDNRTGWLMLAAGNLWAIAALQLSGTPLLFTLGIAFGQLAFGAWVHLLLAFPEGRLRERVDRALVTATYAVLAVFPLATTMFEPTPLPDCDGCPESAFLVTDSPGTAQAVAAVGAVLAIALSAVYITKLVARYRCATPPQRRILGPVYLASVVGLLSIIALNVAQSLPEDVERAISVVAVALFGLVPVSFLLGLLRSRLARGSLADLFVALGTGVPLRDALADALGDPSLTIVYPHDQRWVDEDGHETLDPLGASGTVITPVVDDGELIAALVHDASLSDVPGLIDGVTGAAALALRNQGLQAEAHAQFEFLKTLVETAPALFIHIGLDGRILNQNAAAVRTAGLADQEHLRHRYFWDVFIDPAERDDVIARFEADAPEFPAGEYENAFTNARGEHRVVFWRSAPVHDVTGAVIGIISGGVDITERHEEAEARERERVFLNAIANEAPSLLCLIDESGVLAPQAANRAFERTLELEPSTTGGEVLWERYGAPEDADEMRRHVERTIAGGAVEQTDSTWVTSTGRRLTVSWACTRLPPIDERRLLLVSGLDVTERRQRELEIQRERDATTTVLQAIPGVILVLDRSGCIRDRDVGNPLAAVNRSFRDTFRWSDTELVGRSFLDLVVDDEDGRARAAIQAAAVGETSDEVESEWWAKDGSHVIVSWVASPVVDVTGRTEGLVLVSGVDVTERRRRELEDERRRAFIDAITGTIPSYLLAVHPDATIREGGVNEAFEQAFGWTAEELAGSSFVGTVVPEGDVVARMLIANAAGGAVEGEIESRWDARDGESRIVAWTARPVTGVRGEQLVLVSGSDVTVRRLQEEEIRASRQRIVAAGDEARRKLERNLHDGAQQRLVALSVSLRLAETKLIAGAEGVPRILAEAREELAVALEELRELARGIHPAVLTDRGLGPALGGLATRAPLPVTVSLPDTRLPPAVEAAIYYVVAESLTNVARYAGASAAWVDVALTDARVIVSVRDDGVGGADPAGGSGLRGLADRVAALDGRLQVESPGDGGTCIRAEIPLRGIPAE